MMNKKHIIKKQIIDLTLDSEIGSFTFQSRVSKFFRTEILPLIDAHCTGISSETGIVRIDRLELDLEVIAKKNFETDFKTKFNALFPEELCRALAEAEALNCSDISISGAGVPFDGQVGITKEIQDFEVLEFFLKEGRLPWWVKNGDWYDLPVLVEQSLVIAPDKLKKLLAGNAAQPALVKRLVYHASDAVLEKLCALFLPQQYQEICKLSRDLTRIFRGCALLAPADPMRIRTAVWGALLPLCFTAEGRPINERPLIAAVVKRIAELSGGNYHELSSYALKNIKRTSFKKTGESGVPELTEPGIGKVRKTSEPAVKESTSIWRKGQRIFGGAVAIQKTIGKASPVELVDHSASPALIKGQNGEFRRPTDQSGIVSKASSGMGEVLRKAVLKLKTAMAKLRFEFSALLTQEFQGARPAVTERTGTVTASRDELEKGPSLPPVSTGVTPFSATAEIYLRNAGLVLLWPYLASFWSAIGLMKRNQFINEEANERAVLILQYLACGTGEVREYDLPLNKILCGLNPATPVRPYFEITKKEKREAEFLLQAVVRNWPAVKDLAVSGLRSLFLRREGMIFSRDGHWVLRPAEQACDILLDQMPWGISTVKLPWMEQLLLVEWRM